MSKIFYDKRKLVYSNGVGIHPILIPTTSNSCGVEIGKGSLIDLALRDFYREESVKSSDEYLRDINNAEAEFDMVSTTTGLELKPEIAEALGVE